MGTRKVILAAVAGALVSSAGCGDGDGTTGPAPAPGVLTVTLATPNTDDKAIEISIRGASSSDTLSNIQTPNSSYTLHERIEGTNQAQAALFGDLANGALVTFSVPDVNKASRYTASVIDAADASNALRATTGGYTLTVGQ